MVDLDRIPLRRLKQMVSEMNLETTGNRSRRSTYQHLLQQLFSEKFVIYFS